MLEPLVLLRLMSSRVPRLALLGEDFGGMTNGFGFKAWTSVNNLA
jgi:hypothetical protein